LHSLQWGIRIKTVKKNSKEVGAGTWIRRVTWERERDFTAHLALVMNESFGTMPLLF
jgi:hypothetical protein